MAETGSSSESSNSPPAKTPRLKSPQSSKSSTDSSSEAVDPGQQSSKKKKTQREARTSRIPLTFQLPAVFGPVLDEKLGDSTSIFWESEQSAILRDISKSMVQYVEYSPNPRDIRFVIRLLFIKYPHFVMNKRGNEEAALVSPNVFIFLFSR